MTITFGQLIDGFDDPTPQFVNLDFLPAPPIRSGTSVGGSVNVIGFERELFLDVTQNPGLQSSVSVLPIQGGILNVNNGAGVISQTRVLWDGVGTGSLAADLTAGGRDNLLGIDLSSVDQFAQIAFNVVDTFGGTSTLTQSNVSSGQLLFPFADFAGSADLSSVRSLELSITGPEGLDLNLDSVFTGGAVPEPAVALSLAALMMMLASVVVRRYKRTQISSAHSCVP